MPRPTIMQTLTNGFIQIIYVHWLEGRWSKSIWFIILQHHHRSAGISQSCTSIFLKYHYKFLKHLMGRFRMCLLFSESHSMKNLTYSKILTIVHAYTHDFPCFSNISLATAQATNQHSLTPHHCSYLLQMIIIHIRRGSFHFVWLS